jgi:hypothetical protein
VIWDLGLVPVEGQGKLLERLTVAVVVLFVKSCAVLVGEKLVVWKEVLFLYDTRRREERCFGRGFAFVEILLL